MDARVVRQCNQIRPGVHPFGSSQWNNRRQLGAANPKQNIQTGLLNDCILYFDYYNDCIKS